MLTAHKAGIPALAARQLPEHARSPAPVTGGARVKSPMTLLAVHDLSPFLGFTLRHVLTDDRWTLIGLALHRHSRSRGSGAGRASATRSRSRRAAPHRRAAALRGLIIDAGGNASRITSEGQGNWFAGVRQDVDARGREIPDAAQANRSVRIQRILT